MVWKIGSLEVNAGGTVSFKVKINADASSFIDNNAIITAAHVPQKQASARTEILTTVVITSEQEPITVEAQGLPTVLPYTGPDMMLYLLGSLILLLLGLVLRRDETVTRFK